MNRPIDSVLILGLGLMGGSLGLALKAANPRIRVAGHDRDPRAAEEARQRGVIDSIEQPGLPGLPDHQVVFVATPVSTIPSIVTDVAARARAGTIVTDLGSAKAWIHRAVRGTVPAGVSFVGGHPMTGSEVQGLAGADPCLYQNAVWVLTSDGPSGEDEARGALRALLETLGAIVVDMDPGLHDRVVSVTSHLPYLGAVSIVNALRDRFPSPGDALELAAGGFLDTTRVAACPPDVFRDILLANREPVLDALGALRREIDRVTEVLGTGDGAGLERILAQAREVRRPLRRFRRGFPVTLHELVVKAEDRPGFLGSLATRLGEAEVNIKDFVLMQVREGEPGTILLAFRNEDDLDRAVSLLSSDGFEVHRR